MKSRYVEKALVEIRECINHYVDNTESKDVDRIMNVVTKEMKLLQVDVLEAVLVIIVTQRDEHSGCSMTRRGTCNELIEQFGAIKLKIQNN